MGEAKAYVVYAAGDEWEGQEIVFASNPAEAKKKSEFRHNTDWVDLRVRRYPKFDGKAVVTDKDMLLAGWIWECPECNHSYSIDDFTDAGVDVKGLGDSILCPYCYPDEYGLVVFDKPICEGFEETFKALKPKPAEESS